MSNETTNPYGITREEILDLAATKLADSFADQSEIHDRALSLIQDRVKESFATKLNKQIEDFLTLEMEKLITQEIHPVNMFGEQTGKPTTIREQLSLRAKDFWDLNVDTDGNPSTWGGQPRHQYLLKKIAREEFEKAVKANIDEMVSAFKAALRADAVEMATKHIDKLITLPRK